MSETEFSKAIVDIQSVPVISFPIPGATEDGIHAQLINLDAANGLVTTVIHIAPGATIPAHFHRDGAEAHFVLEGDFIEDGVSYGPGTFLTHAANVVHGPHSSQTGCRVLTMQVAFVDPANPDFHIVS